MRISCKECGKEFQKRTKNSAEMALRMHRGRVHGNIKNGKDNGKQLHKVAPVLTRSERKRTVGHFQEEQREERRQYLRELRARKKAERMNANCEIRYCPICGTNLAMVAAGMNAAASLHVNKV